MGFYFVDPEIYRKYKDQVLEMSQAIQINYPEHLPPEKRKPGFSDRQIAERLGIEERSAEGHVERIRLRLGVTSRAQVAAWWARRISAG